MTPTQSAAAANPLPTGTVTFLFTDIEGSTRLWERTPAAMRAALARHDALAAQCIDHHDGYVFKTGGDAFCAAFHTASGRRWPRRSRRSGRFSANRGRKPRSCACAWRSTPGAVELRDGDYFGAPLNRVARLLAAGHGGQTLLSEATHDLCRDQLAAARERARRWARTASRTSVGREAVFQVCHPDCRRAFRHCGRGAADGKDTPSIAVLPFVNMSRDEENEYFADGLSEELLNVLAKIRGLRVAARTSSFSFKGKDVDMPRSARSSTSPTCSKAACASPATACASRRS